MFQACVVPCEFSVALGANTAWGLTMYTVRPRSSNEFYYMYKVSALVEYISLLMENRLLIFTTVIPQYLRVKLVCPWILLLEYLIFQKLLLELMA